MLLSLAVVLSRGRGLGHIAEDCGASFGYFATQVDIPGRPGRPGGGSDEVQGEGLGDVGGLVPAFDLKRGAGFHQPLAGVLFGHVDYSKLHAHPGADPYRLDEAHAVQPVVDCHLQPFRTNRQTGRQRRNQRQGQETMGDGAAERRLFGLFLVDMDELVVASAIGELVDPLLVDQQPVGMAQVLADIGRQVVDGDGGHGVLHGNIVVGPLGGKSRHGCKGARQGQWMGGFHWCAECCNRSSSWSETAGCTPGRDEHQLVQWVGRKCGVIAGFAHRDGARRSRDVALCVEMELDTPVQLTPASSRAPASKGQPGSNIDQGRGRGCSGAARSTSQKASRVAQAACSMLASTAGSDSGRVSQVITGRAHRGSTYSPQLRRSQNEYWRLLSMTTVSRRVSTSARWLAPPSGNSPRARHSSALVINTSIAQPRRSSIRTPRTGR